MLVLILLILIGTGMALTRVRAAEEDDLVAPWRVVLASALALTAVGVVVLGRLDSTFHVCEKSTKTQTSTEEGAPTTTDVTLSCHPPFEGVEVALLLVPSLMLIAPALSEFSIPGIVSAKVKEAAQEAAEQRAAAIVIPYAMASDFLDSYAASEDSGDLEDFDDLADD